jgi:hypothetical protein
LPRRTVTETELAALPGYEAMPKNRGYYFSSPTGRCAFVGSMPGDECHIHDRWGMVNISKCWDEIARKNSAPQCTDINDGLIQNIASYDFDQSVVDTMSVDRRDEPVLFIVAGDGVHLIDGTHRIRRRLQDGLTDVRLFLMPPAVLRHARVLFQRQQADGSWKQEIGMSDEDLNREISSAEKKLHLYVRTRT